MATISVSLPSDGSTADVSDVNTPITTIVNEINGNLDNANIKDGAAIATSKLADDAGITTAKIADDAVTPEKRSDGFYIGTIAGATLGTTGNKAITGVGFTPKLVRFYTLMPAGTAEASGGQGGMTATSQWMMSWAASGTAGARNSRVDFCIGWNVATSSTLQLSASYVSMDADGFTINVAAANSAVPVLYECYA